MTDFVAAIAVVQFHFRITGRELLHDMRDRRDRLDDRSGNESNHCNAEDDAGDQTNGKRQRFGPRGADRFATIESDCAVMAVSILRKSLSMLVNLSSVWPSIIVAMAASVLPTSSTSLAVLWYLASFACSA